MASELRGSGKRIGYRQMHQRLLVVQKEFVRVIMKDQDPVGVELRSSRRLRWED